MSSIYDVMTKQLRVSFRDNPTDNAPTMEIEFSKDSGSIMPPGPAVEQYSLAASFSGPEEVSWHAKVRWFEPFLKLLPKLPEWQQFHRSAGPKLAVSRLRIPEVNKRLVQLRDWKKTYEKYALSERESLELFMIVVQETLAYMDVNMDHIKTYIKDHERSSLGREHRSSRGHKWLEAYDLSPDQWSEIFNRTVEIVETILANPGKYNDIQFWYGLRARAEGLDSIAEEYDGKVERSRLIMFYLALSIWTAFIPNKAGWYRSIITKAMDYLGLEAEVHVPFMEGGKVYVKASEYFKDGLPFKAYDGKSWETGVALLLGKAFTPFMVAVYDLLMLPSGISVTSLLGTLAMLVLIRKCGGHFVILGDDCNVWDPKNIPDVPFLEFQDADTENRYILGVTFKIDPELAALCGIKITTDRGKEMIPIRLDGVERVYSKKRPLAQRAMWMGMLLGYYGKDLLLRRIGKMPAGEFFSPEEMFERLLDAYEEKTAFAWAEEIGVADVFER